MEPQYYTPEFADIYPGYIFEYRPGSQVIMTGLAGLKLLEDAGLKSAPHKDYWVVGTYCDGLLLKSDNDGLKEMIDSVYRWQHQGPSDPLSICSRINDSSLRTKRLDQSDIESQGWAYLKENHCRKWYIGHPDWLCNTIPDSPSGRYWAFELCHDPEMHTVSIKCQDNGGEWDYFYQGLCPSINELRKIMLSLNIRK